MNISSFVLHATGKTLRAEKCRDPALTTENQAAFAKWIPGKSGPKVSIVSKVIRWIELGQNRANTRFAEEWLDAPDDVEWNHRIEEAFVGLGTKPVSQHQIRSVMTEYRESVCGPRRETPKRSSIWEDRIRGFHEDLKNETHRTYLKKFYNLLTDFDREKLSVEMNATVGTARIFLNKIENDQEAVPDDRCIDCIIDLCIPDRAAPTTEQLEELWKKIKTFTSHCHRLKGFIRFITAGQIVLTGTKEEPRLPKNMSVREHLIQAEGRVYANTISKLMYRLETSNGSHGSALATEWVNVDDDAWEAKKSLLQLTDKQSAVLSTYDSFRAWVRADPERIKALMDETERQEAARAHALETVPVDEPTISGATSKLSAPSASTSKGDPDMLDVEMTDVSADVSAATASASASASASVAPPAQTFIAEIADAEGNRIHATLSGDAATVKVHRTQAQELPREIDVDEDIAELMDTAKRFNEELQSYFPDGKGDHVQDILRSEGRSQERMVRLHEDDAAQAHYTKVFALYKKSHKVPALGTDPKRMQAYLDKYLDAAYDPCRAALLEYAKCVARIGGGGCDDIAALMTAYAAIDSTRSLCTHCESDQ